MLYLHEKEYFGKINSTFEMDFIFVLGRNVQG
jgi:hypothetical protein